MKFSKILGAALIVVGMGLIGYWADCNFWHQTREVRQRLANQADYGDAADLMPNPDPSKLFLVGGVAAFVAGIHYLNE